MIIPLWSVVFALLCSSCSFCCCCCCCFFTFLVCVFFFFFYCVCKTRKLLQNDWTLTYTAYISVCVCVWRRIERIVFQFRPEWSTEEDERRHIFGNKINLLFGIYIQFIYIYIASWCVNGVWVLLRCIFSVQQALRKTFSRNIGTRFSHLCFFFEPFAIYCI